MARRRGAPRVTEREDPLTFVLRNRPAHDVLERLRGQPLMIPFALRKSLKIHPETFRRLISDLDDFSLISIRALPRAKPNRGRDGLRFSVPIGIEITKSGMNVIEVADEVRRLVRDRAGLLPEASEERWLPAG